MSSTSTLKTLTLYGGVDGPNPPKVAMILNELNLPWTTINIPLSEVKFPSYVALNPNGRLPTLIDPNFNNGAGIKVWESGACIEYLIAEYDTDHKLSFKVGSEEYYHAKQWFFFMASGQGPYYGQLYFFQHLFGEKVPSTVERFEKEARRVCGVLDTYLSASENKGWLVGGRCSYVDVAWVSWNALLPGLIKIDMKEEFPSLHDWMERLGEREAVKKVLVERAERSAAHRKKQAEEQGH